MINSMSKFLYNHFKIYPYLFVLYSSVIGFSLSQATTFGQRQWWFAVVVCVLLLIDLGMEYQRIFYRKINVPEYEEMVHDLERN